MKNLLLLFALSLLLASCNKADPSAENEKLVKQYFEHFNQHQWKEMAGMYAANVAFKDPSLGAGVVMQTQQQIIDKYTALGNTIPDVKDNILQIYPSGSKHVVVEFVSSGTAPDGTKFELPICTIFTIDQGKITHDYTYYDNF